MNTILVDIEEQDLINFIKFSNLNLSSTGEQRHKELFKQYPFTLYKKRMIGDYMVTMQISVLDYCLFLGSGLVK